jgi:glycine/D-amino acid oxidase-like deaminating enzyme
MIKYDSIVIGTGIVGSFTALELCKLKQNILVIDHNGLSPGTTRSCDGNILVADKTTKKLVEITNDGKKLWKDFIREFGNECEYDEKGSILVATQKDDAKKLGDHVEFQKKIGVNCSLVNDNYNLLETHLSKTNSEAVAHWPDDAQLQPMKLCFHIADICSNLNAKYNLYEKIIKVEKTKNGIEVTSSKNEIYFCDNLFICAGVWTNDLLALINKKIPIKPRKGSIVVLERGNLQINTKISDFSYNRTVTNTDSQDSLVAAVIESTKSGTILCGSSREFTGFDNTKTNPEILKRILNDCVKLVPKLRDLRIIRSYSGLRSLTPDELPIIGEIEPNIYVATGHEGSGHSLATVTAKILSSYFFTNEYSHYKDIVSPDRFNV